MCSRIDRLEVHNFKTYQGKQVIGPFKDFTAVIGPNGSGWSHSYTTQLRQTVSFVAAIAGKSNLMDAICFVLGMSARNLRGEKMKDLVWHASGAPGAAGTKSASVALVYELDAEEAERLKLEEGTEEIRFERRISAEGASSYFLDGKGASEEEYSTRLAELRIVVKARNFLVFQGDVEQLAAKNSKELLQHFEVFCGSWDFK
jgi:structural maintenance of chromosome 1